ncbi:MAG: DUF4384 domain-containing protein [Elusimicrobiota bacterium]
MPVERMRRFAGFLLAFAVFGAACAHAKPKTSSPPDYAAVRRRAERAQNELSQNGRSQTVSSAVLSPDAAPSSTTVLGKDSSGCTWVESRASVVVGDDDTRAQSRAEAISEARSFAMKDFLGVSVRSRDLVFQQAGLRHNDALVENILRTTQLGRIIKESVVSEGYHDAPNCPGCRYFADIKSCILPVPAYHDGDFHVDLRLSKATLVQGDNDSIGVTCSEDCYAYLYDVGMDQSTQLVAPNDFVSEIHLKAGQEWDYPGRDLQKQGVRLVAQLPAGQRISAETIRVIATKIPLAAAAFNPAAGGYFGVLQRLNASRTDWSEDASVFTIYDH